MTSNSPISVTYSNEKLRILIEEFITMQRTDFTFKSMCSYVLYRAMEDERTATSGLYESDVLCSFDRERIRCILQHIIEEGGIAMEKDIDDDTRDTSMAELRYLKVLS